MNPFANAASNFAGTAIGAQNAMRVEAPTPRYLQLQLSRLMVVTSRLEDLQAGLTERFSPVLTDQPSMLSRDRTETARPSPTCSYGSELDGIETRLDAVCSRMSEILDRCQL